MKKNGKVTQKDVATFLGLNQTTVSRILADVPRFTYSEETRSKVFEAATQLGYLHPAVVKTDKRSSMRFPVPGQAQVRVLLQNGSLYATYTADMGNVNRSGALLRSLTGRKRALPLETFSVELRFQAPGVGPIELKARPVRFHFDQGCIGMGVAFTQLDDALRSKIEQFLSLSSDEANALKAPVEAGQRSHGAAEAPEVAARMDA